MEQKGKKAKGDKYERKVSNIIGEWWCGDKDAFYKSSGSGSRAHSTTIHPGDIAPVKSLEQPFPFCIEAKNRQEWSLDEMFKSKFPHLLRYLLKNHEVDAGECYLSVLIVTRNYYPDLIIIPNWFAGTWAFPISDLTIGISVDESFYNDIIIARLDAFLEARPPETFDGIYAGTETFAAMKDAENRIMRKVRRFIDGRS